MFNNPEFIRNTWTELTPKRLAAMPLLLITVYFLAYMLTENAPYPLLPALPLLFYMIFTYIWGTRLAAEAVVREINAKTWPSQIMTSMPPVKMAIGKLFGSTVYIWYGNIICLALYLLSFKLQADKLPPVTVRYLAEDVLIFILLGLCAHIMPLLVSLHSIRWRHFFEQFDLTFFQFTGLPALLPLYFVLTGRGDMPVQWYGSVYPLRHLIIIFSAIFMAWGFAAIVNQIKTEFGQEPYPVSWFLFTLTLVAVLFGFNNPESRIIPLHYFGTMTAFFAVLCLTYLTICGESNMALRPHMVLKYFKTRQYKRLFMIMPRSLVTIPVIIALAVILKCQIGAENSEGATAYSFMVSAMIFFMLRDFCFIYLWSLFAQGNEKETTVVPVLITLTTYTVVPVILSRLDLNLFCSFFMPYFHQTPHFTFNESAFLTVIPPALEFMGMLVLLVLGIRKKIRELNTAGTN